MREEKLTIYRTLLEDIQMVIAKKQTEEEIMDSAGLIEYLVDLQERDEELYQQALTQLTPIAEDKNILNSKGKSL